MKHTPGPWNADSSYPSPGHMPGLHAPVICVMGDVDVAYVANHWMLESEETQANARLIAASPDLRQVAELAAMERWPRATPSADRPRANHGCRRLVRSAHL